MKFEEVNAILTPQKSTNKFDIFPNPATGVLYILQKNFPGTEKLYVTISSTDGKLLLQKNYTNNDMLDVGNLIPGIYYVSIMSADFETQEHKLLVKQ